eukprot:GHVR01120182.1.p1 GENE.GHVR01120182.1~~GHVR01120182.1.p1  ORF type:complete len:264 (+),score=53.78 GHVR01120182.1:133-924(+)
MFDSSNKIDSGEMCTRQPVPGERLEFDESIYYKDPKMASARAMPRRAPDLDPNPRFGKIKNPFHRVRGIRKFRAFQAVSISGCRDDQTSLDACIGGQRQGAMSYCLQQAIIKLGVRTTYKQLFQESCNQANKLRDTVLPQMDQYFQLSHNDLVDLDTQPLFKSTATIDMVPNCYQDRLRDSDHWYDNDSDDFDIEDDTRPTNNRYTYPTQNNYTTTPYPTASPGPYGVVPMGYSGQRSIGGVQPQVSNNLKPVERVYKKKGCC